MSILITVLYIIACVLLFALAILVHEFGHFIVALKLGLRVEAFSIGFGPALWKRKIKGVEYRISAIPLGGYVSIPDVDPEGTKALEGGGAADAAVKEKIPAWKELLVAFAGPLMNIVLAVVLALVLAAAPGANFGENPAVIGGVVTGGPADVAGLKPGDRVVSVAGHEVGSWMEMQTEVQMSGGRPVEFVVECEGVRRTLVITPEHDEITGMYFTKTVSLPTQASPWMPDRNPVRQLAWDAGSIFRVLKGLVTPKEAKATANALGGPVVIAQGIYSSMRRNAWDGIGFLRFLNVNLAILNLLPIPVLDGGLIMFALIALVFRRRVPEKIVKYVSLFFMVVLMGLMGVLILKDGMRTYRIHRAVAEAEAAQEEASQEPADEAEGVVTNATVDARD